MKIILLSAALALGAGASVSAEPQNDAAYSPWTQPAPAVAPSPAPAAQATTSATAAADAPETLAPDQAGADRWDKLDDTHHYLLLMGSVDGFASAGPGSPCFPGLDNKSMLARVNETGFGSSDPSRLPEKLKALSAPIEQCGQVSMRGYGNQLLKGMPDDHLATYLSGAVRAYASIRSCPVKNQTFAAARITAAVMSSPDDMQPAAVIAAVIREGCEGAK